MAETFIEKFAQKLRIIPNLDREHADGNSQELRKYIATHKPGLDLDVTVNAPSGNQVSTRLSFGVAFFRPFFGI